MMNIHLLSLTFFIIFAGLNANITAQNITKGEEKKSAAKVQQATPVSIFQINFFEIDGALQQILTKNETILHFRREGNTNVFIVYLPEGYTKTDLISLFKSNRIEDFEIMRFQQGARKLNLFNKRF